MLKANQYLRQSLWRRFAYPAVQNARALTWQVPGLREFTSPSELATLWRSRIPRRRSTTDGPRILFFSPRGAHSILYEALVASAVRASGGNPEFVVCGGGLPVCSFAPVEVSPPPPCHFCHGYARVVLERLGFSHTDLRSDWGDSRPQLPDIGDDQLSSFDYRGVPIGRLVQPAVAGYLRSDQLMSAGPGITAYRRFMSAAVPMAQACETILDRIQPERVFMTSGLFFPDSIMLYLCRARGIPVLTYEFAHRENTLVFGWNQPAGFFEHNAAWAYLADQPLPAAARSQIESYLNARAVGAPSAGDAAVYWRKMMSDPRAVSAELKLNPDRPIFSLFTNILWDTALYERNVAFAGFRQWLLDTVDIFAQWPEAQLVIRIHPAEVRLALQITRDTLVDYLRRQRPALPPNVVVVPPESPLSSYTLGAMSTAVLVYASTIGMELAVTGKSVVVAGEVHYRDKGFTFDVERRDEYATLLRKVCAGPASLDPAKAERALRYAHFFFFRVAIPFPLIDNSVPGNVQLDPDFAARLSRDGDPTVRRVAEAILNQTELLNCAE